MVVCGDCTKIIPTLGCFNLTFADPPFNIGFKYHGYNDNIPEEKYKLFTGVWMEQCWECSDVVCLHGPDNLCELYLYWAREIGMKRIAWVNWFYDFGQCTRSNWIDSRCHCLIFAKDNYTWNPEEVLIESARVKYGDKRVNDSPNGGKRLPGSVWGVNEKHFGRVQGNNKERRPFHSNQLPELYLSRLIKAYTNKGDRILDPFGGSGTTLVVAEALGRECATIDISEVNCESIRERQKIGAIRC